MEPIEQPLIELAYFTFDCRCHVRIAIGALAAPDILDYINLWVTSPLRDASYEISLHMSDGVQSTVSRLVAFQKYLLSKGLTCNLWMRVGEFANQGSSRGHAHPALESLFDTAIHRYQCHCKSPARSLLIQLRDTEWFTFDFYSGSINLTPAAELLPAASPWGNSYERTCAALNIGQRPDPPYYTLQTTALQFRDLTRHLSSAARFQMLMELFGITDTE